MARSAAQAERLAQPHNPIHAAISPGVGQNSNLTDAGSIAGFGGCHTWHLPVTIAPTRAATVRGRALKTLRYLLPVLLMSLAIAACGGDGGASGGIESFQKVTPSEQIFTIDDFKAVYFKTSKEYDVEGLTAATSAWLGFWKPGGSDAKEFEVRFYATHGDAVEHGTFFAEEGAGEDAILEPEDATWNEGVKDRRFYFAAPLSHGSGSVQPKYGGYVIYGNMVLLCEGANPEHSQDRCEALISAMQAPESQ